MSADGRFAPSPTGPLHLGSLRTALVAWLMARSQGARFLLRIEDLDTQRSRREFEAGQLSDLRALGIDWDGEPARQSERTALYADAVNRLRALGRVYPCFCSRAEARQAASAPHGEPQPSESPPGELPEGAYPGTCARLPAARAQRRIDARDRYALRLRADAARVDWHDRLLGNQRGTVDDFVVVRSDGVHAYQLAVVVDDAAQRIGEVVRGADLAASTPRQIVLQQLLGLSTPTYAHVPLVLGPDGHRLAKRHHGATLADRDEPAGGTLALLASSLGLTAGCGSIASAALLLERFDLALIPRASCKIL